MDNLAQVLNNLSHSYPRPEINNDWLRTILTSFLTATPQLSRQQQIKQSNEALLASHFAASTLEGSGFPSKLFADPDDPMHQGILFEGVRKGCLVMVVSITEIGSSAFTLQRTLHDRQEARTGVAKIRRLVGEEEADEDEEGQKGPKYARGMLKLELSDGFQTVKAIEYKRIPSLKLGETRLGSKILLQNVKVLRGLLLLTPESCVVKGGNVEGLCADGREEKVFEQGLRERLGKDPSSDPLSPAPPALPQPDQPDHDSDEFYIPDDFDVEPAHALPPQPNRRSPPPAPSAPSPKKPKLAVAKTKEEEEEDFWCDDIDIDLDDLEPASLPPPPTRRNLNKPEASASMTETIVLGSSSDDGIEEERSPPPSSLREGEVEKESQTQSQAMQNGWGALGGPSGSGSGSGSMGRGGKEEKGKAKPVYIEISDSD